MAAKTVAHPSNNRVQRRVAMGEDRGSIVGLVEVVSGEQHLRLKPYLV